MMALLFGLGLGVAAAFAIDYLDDTVKTPEDVTWRLHLNFLGLVPRGPRRASSAAVGPGAARFR